VTAEEKPDFDHLTPDVVLHLVEEVLGVRCSNICRPLNSYINRVYEVHLEDDDPVIAKFYRPNRWSRDALQDEHDFLGELNAAEVPVVAPLAGREDRTLHELDGMYFALFPRKGGRICDEPTPDQWKELGRLLGRVHAVGARHTPRDRITLTPEAATTAQLDYILASGLVPREARADYEDAGRETLGTITPLFAEADCTRIHGDLHFQNLIYRPGECFYVIDFDDLAVGPPVQDVWMLLPGRLQDARREIDLFLEGYETFAEFPYPTLRLIEPLRAMRFIHFTAWCVRQAADGGFSRLAPDWGSSAYWKQEVHELRKQQTEIRDAMETPLFP
jgi:Ser/Thr protein kinase RdoA (MazF antagonist)